MKANTKSLLFALGAAAVVWLIRKASGVAGVGRVERIKRRIYKEVSLAQKAGVDFSKKFDELDEHDVVALETVGSDAGWKQSKRSIESGKSYAEAYYNSLRRAWSAVSGVSGVGAAYNVKDANGRVVLTWIEDAEAHYNAERNLNELESKLRKQRQAVRRRRQRIDREGLPAVVPTPAPVPEPEPIPEPAPVAPKRTKQSGMSINEKRIALLDKAKHMAVIDNHGVIWRGAERYKLTDIMNYVLLAKITQTNEFAGTKDVTIYPLFAAHTEKALEDHKPRPNNGVIEYSNTNSSAVRITRSYKIVPITDVNIEAISGLPES